jgi:6-phosphogluconolactonase
MSTLRTFEDRDTLAQALADEVALQLRVAIERDGRALLAVSGGRTPTRFFERLSHAELDWSQVTVTLCDERCVPTNHERSNEKLVREHLLRNRAQAASFHALKAGMSLPKRIDAAVLGMGPDGHTLSWFPDADALAVATDAKARAEVIELTAPSAPEPRITMTLPPIALAGSRFLHVEGADKRATLDRARAGDAHLPTSVLLAAAPVTIYWSP